MYKLVEMYKNRITLKTCKVPNIHTYIHSLGPELLIVNFMFLNAFVGTIIPKSDNVVTK
jgi:hypothetical protein